MHHFSWFFHSIMPEIFKWTVKENDDPLPGIFMSIWKIERNWTQYIFKHSRILAFRCSTDIFVRHNLIQSPDLKIKDCVRHQRRLYFVRNLAKGHGACIHSLNVFISRERDHKKVTVSPWQLGLKRHWLEKKHHVCLTQKSSRVTREAMLIWD